MVRVISSRRLNISDLLIAPASTKTITQYNHIVELGTIETKDNSSLNLII
jgi:hypothetical protein